MAFPNLDIAESVWREGKDEEGPGREKNRKGATRTVS